MRQSMTLGSTDHELICLIYEEPLKHELDADYGSGSDGYWVEIYDCTFNQFISILFTAHRRLEAGYNRRQSTLPLCDATAKEPS